MINQQVYSKDIVEFVTVGVEYCSLIERAGEFTRKEFVLKLVRILPLLYIKATLLPDEACDEIDELENYVTEEQYESRMLLREVMMKHGFRPLEEEWWHFTLENEPYPDTYFTFTVNSDSVKKAA